MFYFSDFHPSSILYLKDDYEVYVKKVLAIILGGGAGTRLYPLTKLRAKPAVPLAGKYRLIDIPISNCINAEIQKIYILTQFNSASLNRHLTHTYNFTSFSGGFIEVLAAQQTKDNSSWFQGTADAVRQYLWLFNESNVDEYLILSGDHLYRMDYSNFIRQHRSTNADITLAVVPVDKKRASYLGLTKMNNQGRIIHFSEKPTENELDQMQCETSILGLNQEQAEKKPYIASMGIYLFNKEVLTKLLKNNPEQTDFGKEVMPSAAMHCDLRAYLFRGYWEDIGTVRAFYEANLALNCQPNPAFSFYNEQAPIYTRARYLPPTKVFDSHITKSMISEGCIIKSCRIHNSILGIRSRIEMNCCIEDTMVMGADFYESSIIKNFDDNHKMIPIGIGKNSLIKHAIIDKNVRIGENVTILNKNNIQESNCEDEGFYICDGIVIVIKNAVIPDGTVI